MTAHAFTTITCDVPLCDAATSKKPEPGGHEHHRKLAAANGWTFDFANGDLCPKHAA